MTNLQIRVDETLRSQAQQVAGNLGMDLTTAVRVFLRQLVTDQALPFRPTLDPFYNASNQSALQRSIASLDAGKVLTKTMVELEDLSA